MIEKIKKDYCFFINFAVFNLFLTLARILALDIGKKRIGIAVTDPQQMISNSLKTSAAEEIWGFLDLYFKSEKVDCVVVGYPVQLNNQPSQGQYYVDKFIETFIKRYPALPIEKYDERFTSHLAMQAMIDGGVKKNNRRNKALVDTISATIILQDFMIYRDLKRKREEK